MSLDEICKEFREKTVKKIKLKKEENDKKEERYNQISNGLSNCVDELKPDEMLIKTNHLLMFTKNGYRYSIHLLTDLIYINKNRIPVTEQEKFLFDNRTEIYEVDKDLYFKLEKEMEMESFSVYLFNSINEGVTKETLKNGIKEAKEQMEKWLK